MFRSIAQEIKYSFISGNMVTRLVIVNIGIFVVVALSKALFPTAYHSYLFPFIALPGELSELLYKPWTWVSHMFVHEGFFHILSNMIILYWFGIIVGDLLGDKRVMPIYILGGSVGALFYLLSYQFLGHVGSYAIGASAASLALLFAAVYTSPDYIVHLLLFGPVRIKYIGIVILFLDIIGSAGMTNAGGHIAHIGGALFGFLFVFLLRKGHDLSSIFSIKLFHGSSKSKNKSPKKSNLKVDYRANSSKSQPSSNDVDLILEKIKASGYDSLTEEEKTTLYLASKEK